MPKIMQILFLWVVIDVDECLDTYNNPCVDSAQCRNMVPGYKCPYPFGSSGDGTRNGSGCRKIFPVVEAILGTALVIGVLLLFGIWYYFALKHKALIELREQYFRQNGGLLLKQQVFAREGLTDCTRIFSSEELHCTTAGYSDNRILGIGGNDTVYKGNLDGGTMIAIKKSMAVDHAQIEQFINDVVILSQINHHNVIKLLSQIKL